MARGQPAHIKCRSCKGTTGLFITGRSKTVAKYGNRTNVALLEVKHVGCGRAFWTNHEEAKILSQVQPELPSLNVANG